MAQTHSKEHISSQHHGEISKGKSKSKVSLFKLDNAISYISCSSKRFSEDHPSWVQCLLQEETRVPGENLWCFVESNWTTLFSYKTKVTSIHMEPELNTKHRGERCALPLCHQHPGSSHMELVCSRVGPELTLGKGGKTDWQLQNPLFLSF